MSFAPQSFKVGSTLAANRIVYVSAANTVAYPTSGLVLPIGVTADEVEATTDAIPVYVSGSRCLVHCGDSLASGALVASDTSGRAIPFTLANTTTSLTLASAYVGVHLGAKVEVTATLSEILVCPGYDRSAG